MRGWTASFLVPLLVALRASAHGYVSKIVIDGVAYAGNEPNDDTGERFAFWHPSPLGEGIVLSWVARLPCCNALAGSVTP